MKLGRDNDTVEKVKHKPKFPTAPLKCEVWVLNDDYTPQDYVVFALTTAFNKTESEAMEIMLEANSSDDGALVGVYWKDIAYTRLREVKRLNEENGQALQFKIVEHAR